MLSKKWAVLIALLMITTLVFSACKPKEVTVVVTKEVVKTVEVTKIVAGTPVVEVVTATPPPPTPTPTPRPPSPYRLSIYEDLTSTNMWAVYGPDATVWNFYVLGNFYPSLFTYSDQRFDWIPSLATDFPTELTQEGDFWVSEVKMKQGVKWSDGEEITAEDVAFTANTVLELQLPGGNWQAVYDWDVLDHVEAVDKYTVKFYFKEKPGLARWQFGAAMGPILPKHYWESVVEEAKKADDPAATLFAHVPEGEPSAGGFMFDKWEKGAYVEISENPNYFFKGAKVIEYANGAYKEVLPDGTEFTAYGDPTGDVSLEFTVGPYVPSVIYTLYGTKDAAVMAMREGEIDFMLDPLGLTKGLQEQLAGVEGITLIKNPSNGFRYLAFNCRRAPMDMKEFRQAVAILIDKEFITDQLLQKTALPIYTVVPEGNAFWYNPDVPQLGKGLSREERINKALELLKGAGFTWEVEPAWNPDKKAVDPGSGMKMPNGEPVPEMELLAPSAGYDPMRATAAIWIEQWLKEFGIPVKANLTGFNVIVPKVFSEVDFDMYILGWGLSLYPDYVSDFFHSANAAPEGYNTPGYSNPDFDKLADEFLAATDMEEARELSFKLQEILAEEVPYVTLFTAPIVEAYRSAEIQFPYTEVLDGIQNLNGMPALVQKK